MEDAIKAWKVSVIFFGPLREHIGNERVELSVFTETTIQDIIEQFNLGKWVKNGLNVAIDGNMCTYDSMLHDGAEIALLPPVSGG
tara:strand:- start:1400 stop:1654 length:255 start_codon:yes stop_codon:yes gene_type:complete